MRFDFSIMSLYNTRSMNALVIGSSVIDLFLKIEDEDQVKVIGSSASFMLGDKIPVEIQQLTIGGNGANVSVGLARLGISTTFYTYLGNDIFSKEIEESINKEGIKMIVEREENDKSSLSLVFDIGKDRIIFSHHQVRKHEFSYSDTPPNFAYITSVGKYWEEAYKSVLSYLSDDQVPFAFAPGSHQLKEQGDIFWNVVKSSKMLLVNKEEAQTIIKSSLSKESDDMKEILKLVKSLGPAIVSITDGGRGAYTIDENSNIFSITPFGDTVVEKTGAGDSYASGFLASYLGKNPIEECMRWGAINAYSNMQEIGAQTGLLTREQMEKMVNERKDFQAKKI